MTKSLHKAIASNFSRRMLEKNQNRDISPVCLTGAYHNVRAVFKKYQVSRA